MFSGYHNCKWWFELLLACIRLQSRQLVLYATVNRCKLLRCLPCFLLSARHRVNGYIADRLSYHTRPGDWNAIDSHPITTILFGTVINQNYEQLKTCELSKQALTQKGMLNVMFPNSIPNLMTDPTRFIILTLGQNTTSKKNTSTIIVTNAWNNLCNRSAGALSRVKRIN